MLLALSKHFRGKKRAQLIHAKNEKKNIKENYFCTKKNSVVWAIRLKFFKLLIKKLNLNLNLYISIVFLSNIFYNFVSEKWNYKLFMDFSQKSYEKLKKYLISICNHQWSTVWYVKTIRTFISLYFYVDRRAFKQDCHLRIQYLLISSIRRANEDIWNLMYFNTENIRYSDYR